MTKRPKPSPHSRHLNAALFQGGVFVWLGPQRLTHKKSHPLGKGGMINQTSRYDRSDRSKNLARFMLQKADAGEIGLFVVHGFHSFLKLVFGDFFVGHSCQFKDIIDNFIFE